jgi:predicted nucleic acid-binding protein
VEVIPPVVTSWNLGLEETEVLAWAYENPGYEVILDDCAARNCALSLKLPVRGTISVLLLAKRSGLLKEIPPILLQLEQAGFRIDSTIISGAEKLAKED